MTLIARPANLDDADAIAALLTANTADRGGMLYGHWSGDLVRNFINAGPIVVVATDGAKLLGVLLASEKGYDSAPPVAAMLKTWPGSADAYVYGPVCVDQAARGQGVLQALYAEAEARLPGREAILFIRANNSRSLQAHAKLGMAQVARFTLAGEVFIVLSSRAAHS